MDQIGDRIELSIAGNIGHHLLKNWRVAVDYAESTITLDHGADPGFEVGVPFTTGPGGAFILLPATVKGRGHYCFLVDRGPRPR
jgi:hypothetical protein